jgi:hypothetical protein
MIILPVGPRIDTTNALSVPHGEVRLITDLVPWAISTLGEAVSIDMGTGPAFFSNYKFAGRDFGGPVQIVGTADFEPPSNLSSNASNALMGGPVIGNRKSRRYHRPDCPDYSKISQKTRCNSRRSMRQKRPGRRSPRIAHDEIKNPKYSQREGREELFKRAGYFLGRG